MGVTYRRRLKPPFTLSGVARKSIWEFSFVQISSPNEKPLISQVTAISTDGETVSNGEKCPSQLLGNNDLRWASV